MTVPFFSLLPLILAAILLAWVRPQIALLTPLVFHTSYLLRTHLTATQWTLPTTLLEALLVVVVISGVTRILGDRSVRREHWDAWRSLPRRALLCVVVFVVAATVSAAIAPHPQTAWGQWKAFVVEPIVYAALVLPTLRFPGGQRRVAAAILLGGIVSAGLSLAVGIRTTDFGRLRGIYDVPNSLALILAPLSAFTFVLARSPQGSALRRLARWSLALFIPVLLLTQSLGGLGASMLALLILAVPAARSKVVQYTISLPRAGWSVRPQGAIAALAAVAFVLLLGLGLQWASGKLTHARAPNSPLHARLQIWSVALALIRDHPILGTGLGTFEPAYQQKLHKLLVNGSRQQAVGSGDGRRGYCLLPTASCPPLEWLVRDPHNIVLSFWLNTGLLGLLSMAGLVAIALRSWMQTLRFPTADHLVPAAAGGALLTLLLFGLVDVPYFKNDLSLLWWTFLALNMKSPTFIPGSGGTIVIPSPAHVRR